MSTLQTFRNARLLVRSVLAWFVLSVGIAIAAPVVQPQSLTLVCSAAGEVKLLVSGEDGTATTMGAHTLDCVMCLALSAPPPLAKPVAETAPALSYAWARQQARPEVWRTASPLPARGPPSLT
ncbi:DUF2946 family protein [Rhodoferax aquaticus]|uniref:DUF2946 domain-containing protein n=1 Tax=Rhodoferax aquaticus TaxID=2527691 RepID=A0A515EK08_9BURK|nr:DUF2946 family protein [Rhodoferax aquaticus]QDL53003.1 DUF2946 domain-containing protein [Rhodoferax aquaticus]